MKLTSLRRLCVFCLLGTFTISCAGRRGGSAEGYEQFKKQEYSLAASQGGAPAATITIGSYRVNGNELNIQPTSQLAASLRSEINHFMALLQANHAFSRSASKGQPARLKVDFDCREDLHNGDAALKAGLEAGLTLGLLGHNVTHTYDYHMDTTVTVTRGNGESRVYTAANDSRTLWKQQDETGKPALARNQAARTNFETIAAKLKAE